MQKSSRSEEPMVEIKVPEDWSFGRNAQGIEMYLSSMSPLACILRLLHLLHFWNNIWIFQSLGNLFTNSLTIKHPWKKHSTTMFLFLEARQGGHFSTMIPTHIETGQTPMLHNFNDTRVPEPPTAQVLMCSRITLQ